MRPAHRSTGRILASVVFLAALSGCGSCLEDKKVPEGEGETSKQSIPAIIKREDGGERPIVVNEGISFTDVLKQLDGGSRRRDAGH